MTQSQRARRHAYWSGFGAALLTFGVWIGFVSFSEVPADWVQIEQIPQSESLLSALPTHTAS